MVEGRGRWRLEGRVMSAHWGPLALPERVWNSPEGPWRGSPEAPMEGSPWSGLSFGKFLLLIRRGDQFGRLGIEDKEVGLGFRWIWLLNGEDVGDRRRNQVCLVDCVPGGVFVQSEHRRRSGLVGKIVSSDVVLRSIFLWGCSCGCDHRYICDLMHLKVVFQSGRRIHFDLSMELIAGRRRRWKRPSYLKCPWVVKLLQKHITLQETYEFRQWHLLPKDKTFSEKEEFRAQKHCIFVSASHFDKRKLLSVAIQSWVALRVPKCLVWITIRTCHHLMADLQPCLDSVSQAGFAGLWSSLPLHINIDLRLCNIYLLNHFCLFALQSSHNLEMLLPEALQANMISQLQLQMRKIISSQNRGARHFWEIMVNEKTKYFLKSRSHF